MPQCTVQAPVNLSILTSLRPLGEVDIDTFGHFLPFALSLPAISSDRFKRENMRSLPTKPAAVTEICMSCETRDLERDGDGKHVQSRETTSVDIDVEPSTENRSLGSETHRGARTHRYSCSCLGCLA